jgi:hypothetical protein
MAEYARLESINKFFVVGVSVVFSFLSYKQSFHCKLFLELNNSRQEQDVQVHNLQASLGSLQTKLLAGEEELR